MTISLHRDNIGIFSGNLAFDANELNLVKGVFPIAEKADGPATTRALCLGSGVLEFFEDRLKTVLAGYLPPTAPGTTALDLDTVVLVLPVLPSDAFRVDAGTIGPWRLGLERIARVIVLVCGQDKVLRDTDTSPFEGYFSGGKPLMARVGCVEGSDPRVSVVDISCLIDDRSDALKGALRSYEVLGLCRRLLDGASLRSSLSAQARVLTGPEY